MFCFVFCKWILKYDENCNIYLYHYSEKNTQFIVISEIPV